MTDEPLSAAERRVSELLRGAAEDAPSPRADLADRVVRTARWQHAVRGSLAAGGEVAAFVGIALRVALGERRR
jgi:hypothetical protein